MPAKLCKITSLLSCGSHCGSWLCTGVRGHCPTCHLPIYCYMPGRAAPGHGSSLHAASADSFFGVRQWDLSWQRQLQQTYMFPSNTGCRKFHKLLLDVQFWKWGLKQNEVNARCLFPASLDVGRGWTIFSVCFRKSVGQCRRKKLSLECWRLCFHLGGSLSHSGEKYLQLSLAKFPGFQ